MKTVEVEILGSKYHFKTDNADELKRFATYMQEELEKLKKNVNTVDRTKLLVLYSLTLTEKFLTEKDSSFSLKEESEKLDHLFDDFEID